MLPKSLSQGEHFEISQITNYAIKVTFKGFLKVTDLTTLTTFLDTYSKDSQVDLLLVDRSGLKVLSKEVQVHLANTISIVSRKGFKRIAIIEAEDIFAKAGLDKLQREAKRDEVTRELFHSEKAALEWLLS